MDSQPLASFILIRPDSVSPYNCFDQVAGGIADLDEACVTAKEIPECVDPVTRIDIDTIRSTAPCLAAIASVAVKFDSRAAAFIDPINIT